LTTELLRFESNSQKPVYAEVDSSSAGYELARRNGPAREAKTRFEEALKDVESAAKAVLDTFRDGSLRPDAVEVEFGVRLNAEVGAVFAKTAADGHFVLRLTWSAAKASDDRRAEDAPE
jgi:hypothetical protein